jgi:hypothetical protein
VQLGPGEDQPQLPPAQLLSITSRVSIRTFALPSACRAWKCGGPWSSKNMERALAYREVRCGGRSVSVRCQSQISDATPSNSRGSVSISIHSVSISVR